MLPVPYRLKGRKVINDLFRFGKTYSNDVLMLKVGPGEEDGPTKFGFGASLKFSKKAVERNKAKRWMREAVRKRIGEIRPGQYVVFFINPKFPKKELKLELIQEKAENLLKKAKLL